MKKTTFVLVFVTFILWGCSPSNTDTENDSIAAIFEDFEGQNETLIQQPSWASREADFFLQDGI